MDDLDRRIIDHLRRDARAPYTSIAEALGSSEATVRKRVNALVEDGTIAQFTIRMRGASLRALVEVQVETNVLSGQVAAAILELPGVEEVWELTGDWDLVALAHVDATEALNDLVDGIRRVQDAVATRTRVILAERYPDQEAVPA